MLYPVPFFANATLKNLKRGSETLCGSVEPGEDNKEIPKSH